MFLWLEQHSSVYQVHSHSTSLDPRGWVLGQLCPSCRRCPCVQAGHFFYRHMPFEMSRLFLKHSPLRLLLSISCQSQFLQAPAPTSVSFLSDTLISSEFEQERAQEAISSNFVTSSESRGTGPRSHRFVRNRARAQTPAPSHARLHLLPPVP